MRALLCLLGGLAVGSAQSFANTAAATKYAAFSIFMPTNGTLANAIGTVQKHEQNPLLQQDKPWEMRLDNAYPNVVHNPGDPHGDFRLWYGGFIACKKCDVGQGEDRVNAWHYANSSDGLSWTKPALGIYDLSTCDKCLPEARAAGTANNVLMGGDGMGIYRDTAETNASRRFKAFGTGCFGAGGIEGCVSGVGVSEDGLRWTDPQAIHWPAPQRYDCHQNLIRDPQPPGQFVLTTRDYTNTGRDIGIARGAADGSFGGWNTSVAPELVEQGSNEHQLYSQVTFPYYNVWLGLVAVFDTTEPSTIGTVHTSLSWSADGHTWQWLEKDGLTGKPFIPLGTPPAPAPAAPCTSWTAVLSAQGVPISDCAAYRNGSRAPHTICDEGGRRQASDRPLAACRAACSADASCRTVQWQGLEANSFDESRAGRCFLIPHDCVPSRQHVYDTGSLWKSFCMRIDTCGREQSEEQASPAPPSSSLPPPRSEPFDSHIIFSAHTPFEYNGAVRVYYMGGDGPHNGPRNTSLGLALLRRDGFAGLSGNGRAVSSLLTVPMGASLIVSADMFGPHASVRVGALGTAGLDASAAEPLTSNSTDAQVRFGSGQAFSALGGKTVKLELIVQDAIVYTVGFAT